jgi:predicted small lipoprotein YifL
MKNLRTLAAAALLAATLAGCGTTGAPTGAAKTAAAAMQAQKAKGQKATADRPAPPAAAQGTAKKGAPKQGLAARESQRIAERSLYRYADLTRAWERAWSDSEKDRIEQDMLVELHSSIEDIQQVTSSSGHDSADRRAYDIADQGLNRYDRLFREWERAYGDREKRRITNDMLSGMVQTLEDVKRNY